MKLIPLVCILGKQLGEIESIPDDLIVDILSRLPAEEVLKCRKVCRKWRALTWSYKFIVKNIERADPILFMQYSSQTETKLYFMDEKYKGKNMTKRVFNRFMDTIPPPVLVDSCDGLLLFRDASLDSERVFICNPLLQQVVTLKKPFPHGCVFGMFYHPWTHEYRLLYCGGNGNNELFIHSLGSKSWRRLGTRITFGSRASSSPSVMIDNLIYWLVEPNTTHCETSIIVFNIESEELKVLNHPSWKCFSALCSATMVLTKFEGYGLAVCISYGNLMLIWVLEEEHGRWKRWYKKYDVQIWDLKKHVHHDSFGLSEIVNINQNKELLLFWSSEKIIIRYDLETKTARKIGIKQFPHWNVIVINYTKSLVSLKDIYENYGQNMHM